MKKKITRSIFSILTIIIIALILQIILKKEETNQKIENLSYIKIPGRLTEAGPYGAGISTTHHINGFKFKIKSGKLYFKKKKTFGFSNALLKKLVAQDLEVSIHEANTKILKISKNYQELSPDMKILKIDNPTLLFPRDFKSPEKITINMKTQNIILFYKGKQVHWDLNKSKTLPQ